MTQPLLRHGSATTALRLQKKKRMAIKLACFICFCSYFNVLFKVNNGHLHMLTHASHENHKKKKRKKRNQLHSSFTACNHSEEGWKTAECSNPTQWYFNLIATLASLVAHVVCCLSNFQSLNQTIIGLMIFEYFNPTSPSPHPLIIYFKFT